MSFAETSAFDEKRNGARVADATPRVEVRGLDVSAGWFRKPRASVLTAERTGVLIVALSATLGQVTPAGARLRLCLAAASRLPSVQEY